jgi:small subunit ribosomal protein S7
MKLITNRFIHQNCKDPVYESALLYKFSRQLIRNGKKSVAYRILYSVLHEIKLKTKRSPMAVLQQSIQIVSPPVQLKSLRIGGTVYQIPVPIKLDTRIATAMSWILNAATGRQGNNIVLRLVNEIIEAALGAGGAIRKRRELIRVAESNKAFARYRR